MVSSSSIKGPWGRVEKIQVSRDDLRYKFDDSLVESYMKGGDGKMDARQEMAQKTGSFRLPAHFRTFDVRPVSAAVQYRTPLLPLILYVFPWSPQRL